MTYHLFAAWEAWTGRPINKWVKACDVDAENGRGRIEFTPHRADAMPFADFLSAMEFWKRQSTVTPLRDDGKPNRPLTAYTVQPVREDQQPKVMTP